MFIIQKILTLIKSIKKQQQGEKRRKNFYRVEGVRIVTDPN